MDPEQLKKNFEDQIATTDKQIRELEENLAKAKEYKTKLSGGLETIGLRYFNVFGRKQVFMVDFSIIGSSWI